MSMDAVIVSSKYQILIPKEIRESMGIVSGQKIQMIVYRNRIELIPIKPISQMRGFLKGIETEVAREGNRV
jgi:AbrB family looped-hinge helix DNA binding protein